MGTKSLVEIIASKPLLFRKDLARRYSRSLRTIDRWHHEGVLPSPIYLRGCALPMWRPTDIDRAERHLPKLRRSLEK
jgi:hypothetical protein